MAKKEKVASEAEVETVEPSPEKTAEAKPAKVKKTSFDVHNRSGAFVRTYSVEAHGKEAEALAEEYAKKIGGSVK